MRVRVALTLLLALVAVLATGPAHGQASEPDPALDAAIPVGHPRAAVLTVFDSAAESFLLNRKTSADDPLVLNSSGTSLYLAADYEAVFLPLTAGWARFRLAAFEAGAAGTAALGEDKAEVVSFGPARRGGRVLIALRLESGLHEIRLEADTSARAVGVPDWTTDHDAATLWVLVPPIRPRVTPVPTATPTPVVPAPAVARPVIANTDALANPLPILQTDVVAADVAPDPLPLGGLSVGAQRGIAGATALGAVNFETGHDRTLVVRVGQPVRIWSHYELWLADGVRAGASARLAVRHRPTSSSAETAPLAEDAHGFDDGVGPRRDDGTLACLVSFDQAGVYSLVAQLVTRVQRGDRVAEDRDGVPFTVKVVGVEPRVGAIAGSVFATDGLPLEGVEVDATDANGRVIAAGRTNADGAYRIESLEPGSYRVHARPGALNYLDGWWDGKPAVLQADPVDVRAGEVTAGIDFKLTPGGTITGRVVDPAGAGLGGIEITVGWLRRADTPVRPATGDPTLPPDNTGVLGRAKTNDEGWYAIDRLPAGAYWVRASDPAGRFLTEYYDDKPTFGLADKVGVEAGKVTEAIDFVLGAGASVTGQVREESLLTVIIPLPGTVVEARLPEDPERVVARAVSDREGRYSIGGLTASAYLMVASDPNGRHLAEWYREATSPADATPVRVEPGRTASGIDFTLAKVETRARVYIDPARSGVRVGSSGRVAVSVANVSDLGAFEAALVWDPGVLRVDGVALGDLLGSTGRQVVPVEPVIDNAQGTLAFAAGSIGSQTGPNGGGVLFTVRFTALAVGTTRVEVTRSVLTTPSGRQIDHDRGSGHVVVGECMLGDFDCNCVIDIRDVMAVVRRWGAVEGDPDYDVLYDLDRDRDIDIVDVQIEASLWGRRCEESDATRDGAPSASGEPSLDRAPAPLAPDAPQGPGLALTVEPSSPIVGQTVRVAIDVSEAGEVGGFELSVAFDPAHLRFVSAAPGEFLGRTGRTVLSLGPTVAGGSITFGALGLPGQPAPSGGGRLATLEFEVLTGGDTDVAVTDAVLVDPLEQATNAGGDDVTIAVPGGAPTHPAIVPFAMLGQ